MKQLIISLIISCSLHASITFAGEKYLCVADKSVGFKFNQASKEWEHALFKTENSKYIISKLNDSSIFWISKVGNPIPLASCGEKFTDLGHLICNEGPFNNHFDFNKKNNRFMLFYEGEYTNVLPAGEATDENSRWPYIEIGKCSSF